jgi:hypothetical protein
MTKSDQAPSTRNCLLRLSGSGNSNFQSSLGHGSIIQGVPFSFAPTAAALLLFFTSIRSVFALNVSRRGSLRSSRRFRNFDSSFVVFLSAIIGCQENTQALESGKHDGSQTQDSQEAMQSAHGDKKVKWQSVETDDT